MTSLADRAAAPADLPDPDVPGLVFRPYRPADLDPVAALVVRAEQADAAPYRTSAVEFAEQMSAAHLDPVRDTRIGWDADGVPRAWIWSAARPEDQRIVRAFIFGGVDPAWRGRGAGRAIVAWGTGRARQQLAADGRDLPGRIGIYLDDNQVLAARLVAAAGYRPLRYFRDMRRSLAEPLPRVRLAEGLRVVPWSPELDEPVRLAHNEAFLDHWGSEPRSAQAWREGRAMFAPQWSHVALDEATGEVAGYTISGRYEHDWPVKGYTSGYSELLGVRRAWRGRGLGVALLTAAMASFRADGMEYAELDVDSDNPSGAHGLYASLGYQVTHGSTIYGIEL